MKEIVLSLILAVCSIYSNNVFAANATDKTESTTTTVAKKTRNVASSPCTVAQVMKTLREKKAYAEYEYASDYDGDPKGLPTQKRNENSDQYTFWVDNKGTSYVAIVTYDSGRCTGGKSIIKTKDGE